MRLSFLLYILFIGIAGSILLFLKPEVVLISQTTRISTSPSNQDSSEQPKTKALLSISQDKTKPDTAAIIIPLKRIGKLYLIEATIDGETGNLVFDTGASCLVLNRSYFRNHVSFGQQTPGGITGSVGTVDRVTADEVNIGNLKFKKVAANLTDLGHIENRRGVKVIGLFGFELIRNYQIRIDYSNNQVVLSPLDNKGNLINPMHGFKAHYIHKIEELHNVLFTRAAIGGKILRFCFDTGAETNVLSSDLPKSVLQTVAISRTSRLHGSGAAFSEVFYGRMGNFFYGDSSISNMETIITYMGHLRESYGTHIDGMLGFEFISKGIFCINFVKNEMGIAYLNQEGE
ncbi:MAG: hypothetical protein HC905_24240 [Bacteroidales bacterium]|nr:hypothetical protein [Bacteroidales bacterium]